MQVLIFVSMYFLLFSVVSSLVVMVCDFFSSYGGKLLISRTIKNTDDEMAYFNKDDIIIDGSQLINGSNYTVEGDIISLCVKGSVTFMKTVPWSDVGIVVEYQHSSLFEISYEISYDSESIHLDCQIDSVVSNCTLQLPNHHKYIILSIDEQPTLTLQYNE